MCESPSSSGGEGLEPVGVLCGQLKSGMCISNAQQRMNTVSVSAPVVRDHTTYH
jgi:hypothetical protein